MARRKFEAGRYPLKVRRSRSGLGLFTLAPIQKGSCVIEYRGRTISKKEEYEKNSKYLFEARKDKTIDGRSKKNKARYINHACRPNCETDTWHGRVFVMARRNIKAGEELSYDYGEEYFNEYIKPKGCKCIACFSSKKKHRASR